MAAIAGSFLVSYTRARAEALGLRGDVGIGSRAERVVVITAGLVLAPWVRSSSRSQCSPRQPGSPSLQRVLHVRNQLRTGENSHEDDGFRTDATLDNGKVRVAIVGVGNCANSLLQGVEYYKDADPTISSSPA